eukprot:TRINITY_DN1393_c0_g1_i1.p1 TRINITY_DN1393_c0_g1~~TRINITY_DN1393_c0_g1_i1.p1  ORF type:complete len:371 (-),score=72.30 TRINITY_DN1393_c0_g1_i1:84-1196(-)
MENLGLSPEIYDKTKSNPSCQDVINIAEAFLQSNSDSCVGVGGGAPLDAVKIGMSLIAKKRVNSDFDIAKEGAEFVSERLKPLLKSIPKEFESAMPIITGIPTTAGTGSEGGKSAVITLPHGKVVIGHPVFLPQIVGLIPQFTEHLPPHLTAATAVDALFHNVEAFFVTYEAAINDGMTPQEIEQADSYAKKGILLVLKNLPRAMEKPNDIEARLNLQVGALYGAKAFRKGDLGAIHATAHALGAKHHLHHGTAIARMSTPVIAYNESKINAEQAKVFKVVEGLYNECGWTGSSLSDVNAKFIKHLNLPVGFEGLKVEETDLSELALLAMQDGCQTNIVPLNTKDYYSIFQSIMPTAKIASEPEEKNGTQ